MTEGTVSPRAAGVAANPYFLYAWHTYQWARWAPAADLTQEVWNDFYVTLSEPDPQSGKMMLLATVVVNYDGLVSVVWGTRSEAYGSEAGPISAKAGVPVTIECFTVEPDTRYYVNAKWSGAITYPTGTLVRTVQFGEKAA